MSLGVRTTLRPVVWSHIDAHGQNRRRERSPEDEESSGDPDSSEFPPKKKKKEKALGVPALYYPPTLSPSEKLWRDRSRFLFQRGYQLRPRYDPDWTPTIRGNGRHYHSGEDHIMQIVRTLFSSSQDYSLVDTGHFSFLRFWTRYAGTMGWSYVSR